MSLIWIVNILSVFFLCVFFAGIVIPQILLIAFRRRLFDEAGRAEDTSVCSASPWRYGLQARSVLLLCPAFGGQCLNRT